MDKLEKQVRAAIKKCRNGKIDTAELLSNLDLDLMINTRDKYRKEAIIKAIIFRELKGLKFETSLEKFLKENKKVAFKLGFLKNANNEIDIPDRRTFSYFLKHRITDDDKRIISRVVETTREITEKFGISAGIKSEIKQKPQSRVTEENKLAKTRLLREKLYPLINLPVNRNSKCTKNQILDALSYIASVGKFTNGGVESLEKVKKDVPKAYTILRHVKRNKINDLIEKTDKIIERQFKEINKKLRIRSAMIAIDETLIPFYDKGNKRNGKSVYDFVVGGPEKASTVHFIKHLTADIVHDNIKFTLAIVPRRPGVPLADDVRELIRKVKKIINITLLLADRGFNDSKIFSMLDEEGVKYLMPLSESKGISSILKMLPINSVYKNLEYGPFGYKIPYFVYTEGRKGPMKIATSLEIKKDDVDFIKNLPELYSRRWTIETGYRDKKRNAFARTTSTNYVIRLFYFAFSVMLYNAWNTAKFLIIKEMDFESASRKIMSLFSFLQRLYSIEIT
ncbi:MAG: transposase [Thermodesulfobium sp.]